MFDEALRQLAHSVLTETEDENKEQEVVPATSQGSTIGPNIEMTTVSLTKDGGCVGPKAEKKGREWRIPCITDKSCSKDSGHHTPPYLSPGVTRKLIWSKDLGLPERKQRLTSSASSSVI